MTYFEQRQAMKAFGTKAPEPPKPKKPVNKESKKRVKQKRVLSVIKAGKMIDLDGECQLKGPNCTFFATDYEHIQKSSPANYIDPNNGTLSCRNCNRDKEIYPELFKEHSISRFKKDTVLITGSTINGTDVLIVEEI